MASLQPDAWGEVCKCTSPCRACLHGLTMREDLLRKGHIMADKWSLRQAAKRFFDRRVNQMNPLEDIPPLDEFHKNVARYKVPSHEMSSTYMLKLHARANFNGIHPQVGWFAGKLVQALASQGLPFYIHTAWRSPALQKQLKQAGHSKLDDGPHQRSAAVDIVHAHFHWNLSDDLWRYVGLVGEHIIRQNSLPIEWGGRWSFYDPAHWQHKQWRHIRRVIDHTNIQMTPGALRLRFGPEKPRQDDTRV